MNILTLIILIGVVYFLIKITSNTNPKNKKYYKDYVDELPNGLNSLVSMFSKFAKADGSVSQEEIELIDKFFKKILNFSDNERSIAIEIFNKEKSTHTTFEYHCRQFYKYFYNNNEILNYVIDYLFQLAIIDRNLSSEEEILLNEAISIFGVEGTYYKEYKQQKSNEYKNYSTSYNYESYYYEILGLSENCSFDDIKKCYKDLVIKYHPDKFNHLGENFLKVAQEEMKRINEAYDHFKNKYNRN